MAISVLIIDDEIETCRMLSTALEMFGFSARIALSGAEALNMAAAHAPQVIVLDLMMPEMDGFEVARRVRANPALVAVPIIVVTAMGESNAEERALSAGATMFMRKPVSISALAANIKKLTA